MEYLHTCAKIIHLLHVRTQSVQGLRACMRKTPNSSYKRSQSYHGIHNCVSAYRRTKSFNGIYAYMRRNSPRHDRLLRIDAEILSMEYVHTCAEIIHVSYTFLRISAQNPFQDAKYAKIPLKCILFNTNISINSSIGHFAPCAKTPILDQ